VLLKKNLTHLEIRLLKFWKGVALGLLACLLFTALLLLIPMFCLNSTVLSPGFVSAEIQKLDTTELAKELLPDSLPGDLQPYSSSIDSTIVELRPWIDSQTQMVISSTYDYLSGRTEALNLTVQAEIIRQTLVKNFEAAYKKSPPAQYSRLNASQQQQALGQAEQELSNLLPQNMTIEVSEKTLGPDATQVLQGARSGYSFAKTAYTGLIWAAIVLALLIILLLRELKGISRTLGIVLLLAAGVAYLAFWLIKIYASTASISQDWPKSIQSWVPEVIRNTLSPMGILCLIILIAGAALLTASFFFRSDQ
jgi:hypothetical protein